jgi:hypothetical protein
MGKSSRQSTNPSAAEISRLEYETGLPGYKISFWFDGEKRQRDFWKALLGKGAVSPSYLRELREASKHMQ